MLGPVPLPVKLTQYVAPPIYPTAVPDAADDPAAVAALDDQVRATIAGLLAREPVRRGAPQRSRAPWSTTHDSTRSASV
jgi:hypothetical protein